MRNEFFLGDSSLLIIEEFNVKKKTGKESQQFSQTGGNRGETSFKLNLNDFKF
jgi:hypothetical protein